MDFSMAKKAEEISAIMSESKQFIRKQPLKSVLALTNADGLHFNKDIVHLFAEFLKGNKPHIKASALIGINGLTQVVLNGIMKVTGRDIRSFTSAESAKEWLISRDHEDNN